MGGGFANPPGASGGFFIKTGFKSHSYNPLLRQVEINNPPNMVPVSKQPLSIRVNYQFPLALLRNSGFPRQRE